MKSSAHQRRKPQGEKSTSQTVDLSDVTICAADSAFVELTARALRLSMVGCRFGDAILFSDARIDGPFRTVPIRRLASVDDYSHFCLHEMAAHIHTPFALVVQWDGYVINPQGWANAFRKFDYIGAPWHGMFAPGVPLVGNGGFSLRSRKLLKAIGQLPPTGNLSEDRVICLAHRERLEHEFGVRFAPVKLADRFSYQYRIPEPLPFGFHGVEHLWRHAGPDGFSEIAEKMDVGKTHAGNTFQLIKSLAANGDTETARALYLRFRVRFPPHLITIARTKEAGPEVAAREIRDLERLVSGGIEDTRG